MEKNREETRGGTPNKIDWLKVEQEIRNAIREYLKKEVTAHEALEEVDDIIGWHTGRGYEFELN